MPEEIRNNRKKTLVEYRVHKDINKKDKQYKAQELIYSETFNSESAIIPKEGWIFSIGETLKKEDHQLFIVRKIMYFPEISKRMRVFSIMIEPLIHE